MCLTGSPCFNRRETDKRANIVIKVIIVKTRNIFKYSYLKQLNSAFCKLNLPTRTECLVVLPKGDLCSTPVPNPHLTANSECHLVHWFLSLLLISIQLWREVTVQATLRTGATWLRLLSIKSFKSKCVKLYKSHRNQLGNEGILLSSSYIAYKTCKFSSKIIFT